MREILFRAKRLLGNVWINGYYVKHTKRTLHPMGDRLRPDDVVHLIMSDSFSDWGMPREIEAYPVDPSTVGQYTGLVDKNGKMIFEGDIVTLPLYDGTPDVRIVRYSDTSARFARKLPNMPDEDFSEFVMNYGCCEDYEVIGNIHDNPEMLEEADHG